MKKTWMFLSALILVLLATPVFSAESIPIKLSLASSAPGHPTVQAAEEFSAWMKDKSNGKYDVQVLPTGTLAAPDTVLQMETVGSVPVSIETASNLSPQYTELTVFDMPYIFKNIESMQKFLDSKEMSAALAELEKRQPKIHFIGASSPGFRYLVSRKPIKTLADMQGIKGRVSNSKMHGLANAALGMKPTPTSNSEVLSSLQQGVVDATDGEIYGVYASRVYDVAKNYLEMDAIPVVYFLSVSRDWYDKLSPEDRALWDEGLQQLLAMAKRNQSPENMQKGIQATLDKGVTISKLSDADKAEAAKKAESLVKQLNPRQKAFYDKVKAAVADQQ